jgi:hypothetical protein
MRTVIRYALSGALLGAFLVYAQPAAGQGLGSNCANDGAPSISCESDMAVVRAGQSVSLTASGGGTKWMWRAENGKIFGSGSTVRFDTTGLSPGRYDVVLMSRGTGCAISRCVKTIEVAGCPDVFLSADKTSVTSGETVILNATGAPTAATYSWSTSAGRIVGSGATATLETAGTDSGMITVRLNTADPDCSAMKEVGISVIRPRALPPSLLNFNANESRLDNSDKAMLDDVVVRAGQDVSSRIVIIGSATSGERGTRDYLVNEKGFDPSRIDIKTEDNAPQGSVQVFIVPQGADAP